MKVAVAPESPDAADDSTPSFADIIASVQTDHLHEGTDRPTSDGHTSSQVRVPKQLVMASINL
jgi:hypothetical protein